MFNKNVLVKHLGEHNPDDFLLLTMVGSRAFNLENENSDFDVRGIVYDNYVSLFGTKKHKRESVFSYIYEEKKEDIVIYTLRDFVTNAANGSPSALELLGNYVDKYIWDKNGEDLCFYSDEWFVHKNLYHSYLGYLNSNLAYLKGQTLRNEFVKANKNAANIFRIYYQVKMILENHILFNEIEQVDYLKRIKNGEIFNFSCESDIREFYCMIKNKKEELKNLFENSRLPDKANFEKIDNWLINVYKRKILEEKFKGE